MPNKDSLREVLDAMIYKHFPDVPESHRLKFRLELQEYSTSHIEEADRKTLETLAAILNGDERQVEIAKTYILNKLKAKEPKDQLNSKKGKPEQNILTRKEQER